MSKLTVAATVLAAAAYLAPAAAAQTIALTPAADPVEDVPFLIAASGVGLKGYDVYGKIKPAGPVGCGPTYETDTGDGYLWAGDAEGAYNVSDSADVDNPGAYLLCAWMQESSGSGSAIATTSATVMVRSARATLAIAGPTRIAPGTTANFSFSGTSELGRYVFARVKRDGPRGCAPSESTDEGDSFLYEDVQGAYAVQDAPWKFAIDARGTYRICAWVQEGSGDQAPEAVATYLFDVGTSTACTSARNRVTRAKRSVRSAKRAGSKARVRVAKRKLSSARRAARRAC